MNASSLKTSKRLQRVDKVLADRKPHTTRDIARKAHVCAVNSCVDELREPKNGRNIIGWWEGRKFYYRRVK